MLVAGWLVMERNGPLQGPILIEVATKPQKT